MVLGAAYGDARAVAGVVRSGRATALRVITPPDRGAVASFEARNASDAPIRRVEEVGWSDSDPRDRRSTEVHLAAWTDAGHVVATGVLGSADLLGGGADDAIVSVVVDRDQRGQGVGAQVLRDLETRARERGSRRLLSAAYADLGPSLEFAADHGYTELGRRTRWAIDMSRFDRGRFPVPDPLAAAQQFELVSWRHIAEAGGPSDEMVAELAAAHHEILTEVGSGLEPQQRSAEGYRRLIDSLMLIPEATFIARCRGRIVGLAVFCRSGGVLTHAPVIGPVGRGRASKVGLALKVKALSALADLGFQRASLLFDADNAPTRLINELLHFEPERTLVTLAKRIR